ncbi:MAG: hypothetical protein FRX49_00188 [Trebouxia sp. A1-2]|nr:MAG: hypothetical protein FRX49_00188 [Trebouxia sp. A1-2]
MLVVLDLRSGSAPRGKVAWLLATAFLDRHSQGADGHRNHNLTRAARFSSLHRYNESPYFKRRT